MNYFSKLCVGVFGVCVGCVDLDICCMVRLDIVSIGMKNRGRYENGFIAGVTR